MHNSNRRLRQVTLSGEALLKYKFYVIGFVPADIVRLKEDFWFERLDSEHVGLEDEFLARNRFA